MTEEAEVLWTSFIVLLVLCLMGLSIQLGWLLIHVLLLVAFGSYRAEVPVVIQPYVFTRSPAAAHL